MNKQKIAAIAAFFLAIYIGVPWAIAASGRTDFYYTLSADSSTYLALLFIL